MLVRRVLAFGSQSTPALSRGPSRWSRRLIRSRGASACSGSSGDAVPGDMARRRQLFRLILTPLEEPSLEEGIFTPEERKLMAPEWAHGVKSEDEGGDLSCGVKCVVCFVASTLNRFAPHEPELGFQRHLFSVWFLVYFVLLLSWIKFLC
jgi:hypothetical protein